MTSGLGRAKEVVKPARRGRKMRPWFRQEDNGAYMQARIGAISTLCLTAVLAAGCSSTPFGRDEPRQVAVRPAPLTAAPTGQVTAAPLAPPVGATAPATGALPANTAPGLAALDPAMRNGTAATSPEITPASTAGPAPAGAASGAPLARTDLIGSWTVAAAGDSCQLSMVLTTWTGGYRASTRGCKNEALKGISAWNLEGQQVQLFNDTGATVARLYASSKTQFNGQTEGGGPVSVSR